MDHIEQKILEIIDQNAEKIIAFGDDIWHHAELGYQEFRTAGKFSSEMKALGLETEEGIAITGVKSYLKDKKDDELCIALMGEFDALPFPGHVDANPETGAAHCCGHNAQITGVMGAALALADPEIREALGGNVAFMGVPSEEGSTIPEVKDKLMEEGKICYLGGKSEFIRVGAMDDISLTVGHHVMGNGNEYLVMNAPSMGFIHKNIKFLGKSAHPAFVHSAVDTQAAAVLAMQLVNAQREGLEHFYAWNKYILHGVILNGGRASNVVVDNTDVAYEIRGKTTATIQDIAYRVDRAVKATAMATGAGVEMHSVPGYMPIIPVKDASIVDEVFEVLDPEHKHPVVHYGADDAAGTSDFGDLSCIMPVLQFNTGGHNGVLCHLIDFNVADPYEYYVVPAKCFALLAYRLLKDNAKKAKELIAENKPLMTKEEYLNLMESFRSSMSIEMNPVPDFGLKD